MITTLYYDLKALKDTNLRCDERAGKSGLAFAG